MLPSNVPPISHRQSSKVKLSWLSSSAALLVGCGLDVRRSNCPGNSGNGLFATTRIPKGALASVYDGWLLNRGTLPPASPLLRDIAYHWVCNVPGSEFQVRGLSSPLEGRGGGSFANHSYGGNNCKFAVTRTPLGHKYFGAVAESPGPKPTLVLVAISDIEAGEELLVRYSNTTLIRMGMPIHSAVKIEGDTTGKLVRCYSICAAT